MKYHIQDAFSKKLYQENIVSLFICGILLLLKLVRFGNEINLKTLHIFVMSWKYPENRKKKSNT